MVKTAEEIEAEYLARVVAQARAQEAKRFANPDRDYTLEDVWVAYAWTPDKKDESKGEWLLAGFRRKRNLRKPQTMGRFFSKIRRRLGIHKKCPVLLLDLHTAARRVHLPDQSWRFRAPQFQARKPKIVITKPPLLTRKTPKIRAKKRAKLLNKNTKFAVLGRNPGDRKVGYLYMGPLESTTLRLAQFEAKRLFPAYKDRLIVKAEELSKPLRNAMMRSKKVRAGVTRIAWPEVPPTFETIWNKLASAGKITEYANRDVIHQAWVDAGSPWLTRSWLLKQIKRLTPVKSRVVWKDRQFHCVKCKGVGKSPSTIEHASSLCVPISAKEDKACAAKAKSLAKRNADKLRKRKDRRVARKTAVDRARTRKRAAKKAARTRARKMIGGKASVTSSKRTASPRRKSASRNTGKTVTQTIVAVARPLNTLRIVAILRSVAARR